MTTAATSLRQELSDLPDVSRTWFEYAFEDGHWTKILVVEVTCDTDPSSPGFKRSALCKVEALVADVLVQRTVMAKRSRRKGWSVARSPGTWSPCPLHRRGEGRTALTDIREPCSRRDRRF